MSAVDAVLSELVYVLVVLMAAFTCDTVRVVVHHINEGSCS